jgi:hypothetical protein
MKPNNATPITRLSRALSGALLVAGLATTLAACTGDYGPQTSGSIQSDIDSSRWVNQLPPDVPSGQSGLVQSPNPSSLSLE